MGEQPIRIVGIDPGLRRTGWGVIERHGQRLVHIAHGTVVSTAKAPLASRLLELHAGLCTVMAAHSPDQAAVEQTFVNKDARATLKLGHARAIGLLVPAAYGLAVAEYAPNTVKKSVTGSGHADKAQIRAMVAMLLPRCGKAGEDEADALAIAITHAHHAGARAGVEKARAAQVQPA
jgi:crossover junction endodeoxyribonuclease RuvC